MTHTIQRLERHFQACRAAYVTEVLLEYEGYAHRARIHRAYKRQRRALQLFSDAMVQRMGTQPGNALIFTVNGNQYAYANDGVYRALDIGELK